MRIRLYFDEDSGRYSLMRELRARGVDLVSAVEAGLIGKGDPDEMQLAWAAANKRALFSFNRRDFYQLHTSWLRQGRSHCGIILSRQDVPVGLLMKRLLRLLNSISPEKMESRIEFLSNW